MRIHALALLALLDAGCKRDDAGALFDTCYRRCMAPPPGECATGHDWCVRACRTGDDGPPHAIAHLPREGERAPDGPSILVRSLGLETLGGVYSPLIPRCQALPVDREEFFSTATDNQSTVQITVLTGDSPMAASNTLLGRFVLSGIPPAPRAVPQIKVRFHVERSGAVSVTATDGATGKSQSISVVQ
jgi:hypothetical protein